jgi:hypothetical protein
MSLLLLFLNKSINGTKISQFLNVNTGKYNSHKQEFF